jgi:two-component system, OmpR family, sensor histidine kinase ArlS
MSLRYRIAFLFAVLVTVILMLVIASVYFYSVKEREKTFKTRLKNSALYRSKVYADVSGTGFSVLRRLDSTALSLYNKSIVIIANNNEYKYRYSDTPGDMLVLSKNILVRTEFDSIYFFTYENKKAVAVKGNTGNTAYIVAVAAFDKDGDEYLNLLKRILLTALVLSMILSFIAGLVFAGQLVNPIRRITGEVNLITSSNLSERVKVDNNKNELTVLAETFNNLLNRLEESFATQRLFISNASHELSTPLTSISSQLEVAMQKNRTSEEYSTVLQSVYEDIKELQLLTRSLLDIAKTGPQDSIELAPVRMDEILFKVISDVQKQNSEYKVSLDFEKIPEDEKLLTVFGNTNLLYIAFKNIIENGCKYSDSSKSTVTASFDTRGIIILVASKGEVISEADMENIFQPFFRTTIAQSKPGSGLGLTLAKRILSLHKGVVIVKSTIETGTVFTVELPNVLS